MSRFFDWIDRRLKEGAHNEAVKIIREGVAWENSGRRGLPPANYIPSAEAPRCWVFDKETP